jgi:biotin transport system permease protein
MLAYRPDDSVAHRLDPRSKLAVQFGFVVAAFAHTTPRGLVVLSALAAGLVAVAGASPPRALWSLRPLVPFLAAAPLVEAARLGPPWLDAAAAVDPALAGYRVLLVVLVGGAYVRSTPVAESRAAVTWLVPGRAGRLLGAGVGFVFRLTPVVLGDVRRVRTAQAARLGTERPLHERVRLLVVRTVATAFRRADRFAVALRARCFAWNPTPPALSFGPADAAATALGVALAATALV